VLADNRAVIELLPGLGLEQAAADLAGFERVWVVFIFHLNHGWRPKVAPPLAGGRHRIGVFATRSPHRPNPIGLTCAKLDGVDGLRIMLRDCDILDGSPVLDIKPYIPDCDSFPDARTGWREGLSEPVWTVGFSEEAARRMAWIMDASGLDLANLCQVQLSRDPLNHRRKRVAADSAGHVLACRTWRMPFTAAGDGHAITVHSVLSGYSGAELAPDAPDPHGDKEVHRRFLSWLNG
jgi:tRNA-Thr(GGU) m(6)t(6)A37 methyltransferase TsaA